MRPFGLWLCYRRECNQWRGSAVEGGSLKRNTATVRLDDSGRIYREFEIREEFNPVPRISRGILAHRHGEGVTEVTVSNRKRDSSPCSIPELAHRFLQIQGGGVWLDKSLETLMVGNFDSFSSIQVHLT